MAPKRTQPCPEFVSSKLHQPSASAVPKPRASTSTASSDSEDEETPQFGPTVKHLPVVSLMGGPKPPSQIKAKSNRLKNLFHLHRNTNSSIHRSSLKYQRLIKGKRLPNTHPVEIDRRDSHKSSMDDDTPTEFARVTVKSITPNSSTSNTRSEITSDTQESVCIHTQYDLSPKVLEEQSKQATAKQIPPWVKTGVAVLPPAVSVQESSQHAHVINAEQGSSSREEEMRKKAVTATQFISLSRPSTPITTKDDSSSMEQKQLSTKEVDASTAVSSNGITRMSEISRVKPPLPLSALRKSSEPLVPTLSALRERQQHRNRRCSIGMPASSGSMQPQPNQSSCNQYNLPTNRHGASRALTKGDHVLSISDLIRPARRSLPDIRAEQSLANSPHTTDDVVGVLKIRVTGVNMGLCEEQQSNSMLSQLVLNPEESVHIPQTTMSPSEGLYCTLSINGGSTRVETSVKPIYPRRPVIWDNAEEFIFYAKPTQQIFVMCSKIGLDQYSKKPDSPNKMRSSSPANKITRENLCIGAATLPISTVHISSAINDTSAQLDICHPLSELQFESNSLPLQPTGSLLLQAVLYGETICIA